MTQTMVKPDQTPPSVTIKAIHTYVRLNPISTPTYIHISVCVIIQ